jgi:hypothetical protein
MSATEMLRAGDNISSTRCYLASWSSTNTTAGSGGGGGGGETATPTPTPTPSVTTTPTTPIIIPPDLITQIADRLGLSQQYAQFLNVINFHRFICIANNAIGYTCYSVLIIFLLLYALWEFLNKHKKRALIVVGIVIILFVIFTRMALPILSGVC